MRRLAIILIIRVGACIVFSALAGAAGSINFEEVMRLARQNPKLLSEIEEVMRAQKIRPREISCEAGRFGHHWKYLGGGRSLPISCIIGKRSLGMDGNIEYRVLGRPREGNRRRHGQSEGVCHSANHQGKEPDLAMEQ